MLVPPQLIPRPGAEGSPNGQCEISGAYLPGDGPYILVMGKFYSRAAVVDMARAFKDNIVLTDTAHGKVETLVKENASLRGRIVSATEDRETLHAEVLSLRGKLGAAQSEARKLAAELSETRSLALIADEFLSSDTGKVKVAA